MSNSMPHHRQQPARLPRPRDSPGKNTGVGCHLPVQCTKVKRKRSRSVVSDPQQSHGLQPIRLPRPWDPPGKSTEVGCTAPSNSYLFKIVILYHTMIFLFSNYFGIFILFFIVATPDYILANSVQGFSFLHNLTSIYSCFFDSRHFTRC